MGQFGEDLRQERESRGISVAQICAATKISSRHIEALEAGNFRDLPGGVFRKGIVRSYITTVGLSEPDWLERYEAAMRASGGDEPTQDDWAEFAENVRRNRVGGRSENGARWLGVAAMILGLLLCCWLLWRYLLQNKLTSKTEAHFVSTSIEPALLRQSHPLPPTVLLMS